MSNLLSFGEQPQTVKLTNLNVLIGANGSGKSNFIEVLGLLQSAPKELSTAIINGGPIEEWLWKGGSGIPKASIEAIISRSGNALSNGRGGNRMPLRYKLRFSREGYRFVIKDEVVEDEKAPAKELSPLFYFRYVNGIPMLKSQQEGERALRREEINSQVSILAQRKDPDHYPEITHLGRVLAQIRLYRDWEFGSNAAARQPCDANAENDYLHEDGSNLAVVLDRLLRGQEVKRQIIESVKLFYEGATDLRTSVEGGKVQIRLEEKHMKEGAIPLMRLSDGTLRWLALLSILLNPNPQLLVCIEEPELGLHPDMIQELGRLLVDASTRMQLVVTTHSDALVEFFSDQPECVLVCEKEMGSTRINRLSKQKLSVWLDNYGLGELWRKGKIGANRW